MNITVFGIDIAKNVFQLYSVDQEIGEITNKQVKRKVFALDSTLAFDV